MIKFSIPGIYNHFKLNKAFIDVISAFPQYVNDNFVVCAVYGCFPTSIWNGGRKIEGFCSVERMKEEIGFYNSSGLSCRYTFTNSLLQTKHLEDCFSNLILSISNNGLNGVIINSKLLEEYIRRVYPAFHIISSTTKCITDFDCFEDECHKAYDLVVLDYTLNHSERLKTAKTPHKIEILLNAYCVDNCSERRQHYEALSQGQLAFSEKPSFHSCPFVLEDFYTVKSLRKSFVSLARIRELSDYGITNFKIEGRTNNSLDVLESYLYYVIKSEYQPIVRLQILKELEYL